NFRSSAEQNILIAGWSGNIEIRVIADKGVIRSVGVRVAGRIAEEGVAATGVQRASLCTEVSVAAVTDIHVSSLKAEEGIMGALVCLSSLCAKEGIFAAEEVSLTSSSP